MSFVTIHQHPEWELITKWFDAHAEAAGVSKYQHVEHISVPSAISPEVEAAATDISYRLGESLKGLYNAVHN